VVGDVLLDDCGGHVSSLLVLAAAIPSAPAKTRPATAGTVEPVAVATNRPAANAAKAVPISTSSTARPSGSCASPVSRSSSRITASVLAGVDTEVAPTLPPGHSGHRQREVTGDRQAFGISGLDEIGDRVVLLAGGRHAVDSGLVGVVI